MSPFTPKGNNVHYCCSKLISGSLFRFICRGMDHDGQKRNIKQLNFLIVTSGYIKQFECSRHAIRLSNKSFVIVFVFIRTTLQVIF